MKTTIFIEPKEEFKKYVEGFDSKERHTPEACKAVEKFSHCIENIDTEEPNGYQQQAKLYHDMMDVAVEFEESGFMAGMWWALNMVRNYVPIRVLEKGTDEHGR